MADSEEPKRPSTPPPISGKPLPRLWKHLTPEEEAEEARERQRAAEKEKEKQAKEAAKAAAAVPKAREKSNDKKKSGKDEKPAGVRTVLKEETPELDTYESRQKIRMAIGAVMVLAVMVVGYALYRALAPEPTDDLMSDTGQAAPNPAAVDRERIEKEAGLMLDRAREFARNGKTTEAVAMLQRIGASYPATRAASEAKEALDRPAKNLPLFLDRPAVVADGVEASPATSSTATPGPAPRVVDASPSTVAAAKGASASLTLPANEAETQAGTRAPDGATATTPARPLPKGFYARPGVKVHTTGWPVEIVGERDGAPMVLVVGGSFTQGRDGADPAEAPAHKVGVSTFYVDQHETTVRQFKLFQREAGRRSDRDRALARDPSTADLDADDRRPVVMVSARDAADYAAWAGKRLPTEVQWEAAARLPDGRLFPWGNTPGTPRTGRSTRNVLTVPTDLAPSGAFDLGGNAWEWTKDWYDPRYYQSFRGAAAADNPTGPATRPRSQQLVVKGSSPEGLASKREGIKFDSRLPYLGFRCVLPVEGPGNAFEGNTPGTPSTTPGNPPAGGGGSVVPF